MDSKIVGMIDAEIRKLSPLGKRKNRYRKYENAKKRICAMFPGHAEHEYICKSIAKKYKI